MLWNPRMFQKYPDFLAAIFRNLLKAEGPKQKMKKHVFAAMKETGLSKKDLLLDGLNAGANL